MYGDECMENKGETKMEYDCPVVYSLGIIGRKWALPTLCELNKCGVMRYGELKKKLDGITNMALTQLLKDFVKHDIVNRIQYNEIPPKVEYSLTPSGKKLIPSFYSIAHWGMMQMEQENIVCTCENKCYQNYYEYVPMEKIDELQDYPEKCDKEYRKCYQEIKENNLSVRESLEEFMLNTIHILSREGEEFSRWTFNIALRKDTSNLYREDRVSYQIMHLIVEEAKQKNLLKTKMSTDQVASLVSKMITGTIGDWQIANCAYDVVEENRDMIHGWCEMLVAEESV